VRSALQVLFRCRFILSCSCVVCVYLIDFMMKDKHGPETAFELRTTFGYTGDNKKIETECY